MTKRIAFFDFDGTISTKDTLFEFIRFSKGTFRFCLGFLLNSPVLVAYKLKLISNQTAKEIVLGYFYKNMPLVDFDHQCRLFAEKIPGLIRPKAMSEIEELKKKGTEIVIVSASPENWLKPWTDKLGLQLIGTRLKTNDGKLTGSIEGKNCYGDEKVCRIEAAFSLSEFDEILAYGDTSGDRPMLGLANVSFYKPFR